MEYKRRYLTTAEMIMQRHSGWSGIQCETCKRATTNAQLGYSMRFFRKPLCRTYQSLESYRMKYMAKNPPRKNVN